MESKTLAVASKHSPGSARQNDTKLVRMAFLTAVSLVTVLLLTVPCLATGNIVASDLAGAWQIALFGYNANCTDSMVVQATATLNAAGAGPVNIQIQPGCLNNTTGQFTLTGLATNGLGTATMTCGANCTWTFSIQVSPDRSKISFVDLTDAQFLSGVAVLSSAAGHFLTSDLTGSWQASFGGYQAGGSDCTGQYAYYLATFTLDATGVGNINLTGNSCTENGTITVALNADGSGTAVISCSTGCFHKFNIQVSPDRSMFYLVDLGNQDFSYLEGVATNNSTASDAVLTNLAGEWTVQLSDLTSTCYYGTTLVRFNLSARGASTNASETIHSSFCGDSSTVNNSFSIQSLNANGSGRATLACGAGCASHFNIQVSADRSTFELVDVSDSGTVHNGWAIHE